MVLLVVGQFFDSLESSQFFVSILYQWHELTGYISIIRSIILYVDDHRVSTSQMKTPFFVPSSPNIPDLFPSTIFCARPLRRLSDARHATTNRRALVITSVSSASRYRGSLAGGGTRSTMIESSVSNWRTSGSKSGRWVKYLRPVFTAMLLICGKQLWSIC